MPVHLSSVRSPGHSVDLAIAPASRSRVATASDYQYLRAVDWLPAARPSDHSLAERSRGGDETASEELYRRYIKRLKRAVIRRCSNQLRRWESTEDIIQSVFATFFRRITAGSCVIAEDETAWKSLRCIARDTIRAKASYYRAAKRDVLRTIDGGDAWHAFESRASDLDCEPIDSESAVRELLERLPAGHRLAVRLLIDGFTMREVASRTFRTRRTLERILREARESLGMPGD